MNKWENQIEQIIDEKTLTNFIAFTQQVLNEKAQHIADNWQDYDLAKKYNSAADMLQKVYNYAYDEIDGFSNDAELPL
jgi:hypothetical protein